MLRGALSANERRTIIVGDLHGCLDELVDLLALVELRPDDELISVGDLVGKGPDGAGVVRFFRKGNHRAVRGNHDEKLLAFKRGDRSLSGTHRAHADAMKRADWQWLTDLPLAIPLPTHGAVVVHAGVLPGRALDEQTESDLLNLRSIRPDGSGSIRIEDGVPWASLYPGPELVVFGHDAVRGAQHEPHAIGLDTGCVYGGTLSALILPDREIVSVAARRDYVGGSAR